MSLARAVHALCLTPDDVRANGGVEGCVEMLCGLQWMPGADCTAAVETSTAAAVLASTCEALLEDFPTSAAQDKELLQRLLSDDRPQLSEHRRVTCIRSRLSRKRCLAELRDACAARPVSKDEECKE